MAWAAGAAARVAAAGLGVLTLAQVAMGQAPPAQPAAAQTGVRTFDPPYFSRFNPVTALDMVRQLPGFFIDNGDALRGFGATAGNVLIDGERPSSKTSISDELSRIPARDIARIDLIGAAAAGDIDVRGYTELANVVMKPAAQVQVSTTYSALLGLNGQRLGGQAGASRNWKAPDFNLRLNGRLSKTTSRVEADITNSNAAGTLTGTRNEFSESNLDEILLNNSLTWTPTARDTIGLTGRVMGRGYTRGFHALSYNPAGALSAYQSDDYTEKDILYLDLGGDWEHKFSPESSLKLVTVNSFVGWRPQEFFEGFDPSGVIQGATRFNTDNTRGEHILRGVWTQRFGANNTLELGLEGAYNYRDTVRAISDSVLGGPFTPRILPITTTRVEEDRYEAFINNTWRASPQLTLEAGFNYEVSTITQSGDASQERDFEYPKPHIVGTWTPTKADQVRLSVERSVAQLDFGEFASNVSLTQGNQLTIGNPNLEPEQYWSTQLVWKHAIGQRGSVSLTLGYDAISDVQDLIPIRPDPNSAACQTNFNGRGCVFTAAGNIGDGENWGARIEAQLPLDSIGVKGGQLKFVGGLGDNSVTDPITGQKRWLDTYSSYDWNIDFRQDLPELKLAWGGDYGDLGKVRFFRLDEEQTYSYGPGDLDLFVETTYFDGVTVRLSADNLGLQTQRIDRRFYDPNRLPGGVYARREFWVSDAFAPTYALTISGSF
ncbi:MAG TPA: TonB-dependent receptor [Hyphomonadaceae bacterium]|jgi:outer membrane receptor protein involved in Fe transport|nr:TonB-dependent receptor [Hyphomonadaceae bacterium]